MNYSENGEYIADVPELQFAYGSTYLCVETFYDIARHLPTRKKRLEAARREIEENRQKEIDGFIYGKCSKCDFGSSDYYLFKSHFTNGVCNSENSL